MLPYQYCTQRQWLAIRMHIIKTIQSLLLVFFQCFKCFYNKINSVKQAAYSLPLAPLPLTPLPLTLTPLPSPPLPFLAFLPSLTSHYCSLSLFSLHLPLSLAMLICLLHDTSPPVTTINASHLAATLLYEILADSCCTWPWLCESKTS